MGNRLKNLFAQHAPIASLYVLALTAAAMGLLMTSPVAAQQLDNGEIIVTAMRSDTDEYEYTIPAVGLQKLADFAVQQVVIEGDSRNSDNRRNEIYRMIRNAILLASNGGQIELATGKTIVEPVTLANYKNIPLKSGRRPDTERAHFLIKTRLKAGTNAKQALAEISAFIKTVKPVGRAQMEASGDLTLSVVRPVQYRNQIIDYVIKDAKIVSAKMGAKYGVEIEGLDRPVEWSRASLTDVFLYVPYRYKVVPKE